MIIAIYVSIYVFIIGAILLYYAKSMSKIKRNDKYIASLERLWEAYPQITSVIENKTYERYTAVINFLKQVDCRLFIQKPTYDQVKVSPLKNRHEQEAKRFNDDIRELYSGDRKVYDLCAYVSQQLFDIYCIQHPVRGMILKIRQSIMLSFCNVTVMILSWLLPLLTKRSTTGKTANRVKKTAEELELDNKHYVGSLKVSPALVANA